MSRQLYTPARLAEPVAFINATGVALVCLSVCLLVLINDLVYKYFGNLEKLVFDCLALSPSQHFRGQGEELSNVQLVRSVVATICASVCLSFFRDQGECFQTDTFNMCQQTSKSK